MSETMMKEPLVFKVAAEDDAPVAAPAPVPVFSPPAAGMMPVPISLDDRVREFEASLIRWALRATHGNKSRAAALLQIKRSTLGDRIARCGLGEPTAETSEQAAV